MSFVGGVCGVFVVVVCFCVCVLFLLVAVAFFSLLTHMENVSLCSGQC